MKNFVKTLIQDKKPLIWLTLSDIVKFGKGGVDNQLWG